MTDEPRSIPVESADPGEEVRELRQLLAASKYGLPEALASRLQGQTRAELEADAQSLARLVNTAPRAIAAGNSLSPVPTDADRIRERIDGGRSPFFDPAFHIARGGGPQVPPGDSE